MTMRWNPFRRPAAPAVGRHTRAVGPSVPGAAATLVAVAAAAAAADERPAVEDPVPDLSAAAPLPQSPVEGPETSALLSTPDEVVHQVPEHLPGPPVPGSPPVAGVPGSVRLGFADGAAVELATDDPRAAGLRAVADALLEAPAR
jgi:hypothetical protein